ncbi:MAG: glycosyltransferase family 39 protein, partial [Dehalococcoidia bacterium]|nr:glycosyltransferase family 39 protein [Dehalococcoidia bacterium]
MSSSGADNAAVEVDRDLSQRTASWGLAIVLVLALALRLYGLNWDDGFGWTPHPDERAILFKVVDLSFPGISDLPLLLDADESPWNPRWFPYGSFPIYLLKTAGVISSFVPGFDSNDLRVPGRAVSALADVATIALVYALGAMVWSRRVGLLASALVAIAVIHIQLSHFFAVDTLMALFCFATMLFLVRVARSGKLSDSVLAGIFLGLGLATKISVAPILAAYFVAHFIAAFGLSGSGESQDESFAGRATDVAGNTLIGTLAIIAAFLVAQPYALLDWNRFSADIIEQSEMVRRIRDYPYTRQYIDTTPYLYHIQQLSVWGLGLPLGIVAWAGMIYAALKGLRLWWSLAYILAGVCLPAGILVLSGSLVSLVLASSISVGALVLTIPLRRGDTRITALLLCWVVPYFLITGAFDIKFMRYMIPITPFLLLFAALLLTDVWCGVGRLSAKAGSLAKTGLSITGALALLATVFYAVSYVGIYSETHSAVRSGEWIQSNVPRDSLILREHWDEGVPGLGAYEWQDLELYNHDSQPKLLKMSDQLAKGDYILIYSNRLYGTIPRLPERYP